MDDDNDDEDMDEIPVNSVHPKTMQELAEAQHAGDGPVEEVEAEEEYLPDLTVEKDPPPVNGKKKGQGKAKTATAKKPTRATASKVRPSTRKKRALSDDSEVEIVEKSPPKKRKKAAPPVVASTRTLRSRAPMNEAQKEQQNREAELDRTLDELDAF